MKNFLFFTLIILFAACIKSKKGSGNIISNTRDVGSFTAISAAGSVNVSIQNGPQTSVIAETDDNIMPHVITNVSGGTLRISLKDINRLKNSTVNVKVSSPEITEITSSGSAEIESIGIISSASKMELKTSSGSKIQIEIDAPAVKAEVSSGGSIIASGRTRDVTAKASSGSNLDARALKAENAIADASSGASIKVSASLSLQAEASSGATVKYIGGAQKIKKNESSGGSVRSN